MLDEDDRLEGAAALGREGVHQRLDRWVEPAEDRDLEEQQLPPGEHAPAGDVPGDDAHQENNDHRGEEAEPAHGMAEDALVHRLEDIVDPAPEDPQEPGGGHGGDGHEKTRGEPTLQPVSHARRHNKAMMTPQRPAPLKKKRRAPVTRGAPSPPRGPPPD